MKALDSKIIELLKTRGIETEEELQEFLSDRPQKTHDPFLLRNMEEGVDLILSAVDRGDKICIYGDYDADGITSTVILTEVLSQLTDQLSYYIPSRFDEGYGLNCEAVKKIHDAGIQTLITVDCGSVSVDEVEYAKELGMTVLVTDHHRVTDRKADCVLINPNQPECTYPNPNLAGCGVAFKVAQALTMTVGLDKHVLNQTLDLVGIGTIGDVVPLVGENRTFAKYGIRTINSGKRKNLQLLIQKTGLTPGKVSGMNVAFVIVPHLNAAGRMQHAGIAAELLMTRSPEKAEKLADRLVKLNSQRKTVQNGIYADCMKQVQSLYRDDEFLVVEPASEQSGVTGIVAGKIRENTDKPTVLVTPNGDGTSKGTGRSMPGVDLYQILKKEEALFTAFGGHAQACGFTIHTADVPKLREDLNASLRVLLEEHPELRDHSAKADMVLDESNLTVNFCEQLEWLAPFGTANEEPLVEVLASVDGLSRMGNEKQYLRFTAFVGSVRLSCSAFAHVEEIEEKLLQGQGLQKVLGYLTINEWNGRRSPQLRVIEVQGPAV